MKHLYAALTAVLSAAVLSAQSPVVSAPVDARKAAPSRERVISPAAARSNMLARTGGIIQAPAEGPSILFLNTQKRVADAALNAPAEQVHKMLRLPTAFKSQPSDEPVTEALNALKSKDTAAVVVVADIPGYPALLIAPENRWAIVNVAALGDKTVAAETLADRTQKELWRAFGYLMGAAHSNFEVCLMKPVTAPEDLDALTAKTLGPEPLPKIMAHAQKLGVKPMRTTTYRKAVEEGWALAPTNDFQKAIWDELKSMNP